MVESHPVSRALDEAIRQQTVRLDYLCREFKETEADLAAFLAEYYDKIGQHLATLPSPSMPPLIQKKKPKSVCSFPSQEDRTGGFPEHGSPHEEKIELETEIRQLYLFLVRKLHPDVASQENDPDLIKQVTQAYRQHRLGSLWKILFESEWQQISALPPRTRHGFLLHYRQRIGHAISVMENRLRSFYQSPEYILQQRVFAARLRGEDLLSHIVEHICQEADRTHRRLEYYKMREQLMQEAAWA